MAELPYLFHSELWEADFAIRRGRRPDHDYLAAALRHDHSTPTVSRYVADLVAAAPKPVGHPRKPQDQKDRHMGEAARLLFEVRDKAKRNGHKIRITAAISEVAARRLDGFGRTKLWEAVACYEAAHNCKIFSPQN